MAFPTDHIATGAPTYGLRKGHEGIIFHTDEGNFENTIVGGKRLATWQASSANTSGGSYNFIVTKEGVVLSVPYLEASGGVTGARVAGVWDVEQHVQGYLTHAAWNDPNAYLLNVCMLGKTAFYEANGWPAEMIDLAARLVIWFEDSNWGADNAFLCNHEDFQLNRSDPGQKFLPLLMERYIALRKGATVIQPAEPVLPPPPVVEPDYKVLLEETRRALAAATTRNAALERALTEKNVQFDAAGRAVRTLEQQLATAIENVRVPLRAGRQITP